jgi:hypothetical protein
MVKDVAPYTRCGGRPEGFRRAPISYKDLFRKFFERERFVDKIRGQTGTGTFEENRITVDSVGCAALLVVRLDAIIGAI